MNKYRCSLHMKCNWKGDKSIGTPQNIEVIFGTMNKIKMSDFFIN